MKRKFIVSFPVSKSSGHGVDIKHADHMIERSSLRSVVVLVPLTPAVLWRLRQAVLSALAMHRSLVKVNGWLGRLCAVGWWYWAQTKPASVFLQRSLSHPPPEEVS